jgi:hypothetical protein
MLVSIYGLVFLRMKISLTFLTMIECIAYMIALKQFMRACLRHVDMAVCVTTFRDANLMHCKVTGNPVLAAYTCLIRPLLSGSVSNIVCCC